MGKNRNGIPERWEDYGFISEQIPGTRFVAFKVPLKAALLKNLDSSVPIFDVNLLMEYCPNLGLVVDLTNTDRYYDSSEILHHKVSYCKLKTMGHVIPANHIYFKFFQTVQDFLSNNKNNDKLIGVHCTHGVNRTGYLIIRYMIQQLNINPQEAISAFNSARGHAVERENYLMDLQKGTWPIPPKWTANTVEAITNRNPQEGNSTYGDKSKSNYWRSEKYDPYQKPHSNYFDNSSSQLVSQQHTNRSYKNFRASERGSSRAFNCSVPNQFPETSNSYDRKNCYDYKGNKHTNMSSSFRPHSQAGQNWGGPSSSPLANNYHRYVGDRNTDRQQHSQSRKLSNPYHDNSSDRYLQGDKTNQPPSNSKNYGYSQRKSQNFNSPSWRDKSVYSWRA